MKRIVRCGGIVGALVCLGATQPVWSGPGGSNNGTQEGYYCVTGRLCSGTPVVGECAPNGFFCLQGTCGNEDVWPFDGCRPTSWHDCVAHPNWACHTCGPVEHWVNETCKGKCPTLTWTYNQCSCTCGWHPSGFESYRGSTCNATWIP